MDTLLIVVAILVALCLVSVIVLALLSLSGNGSFDKQKPGLEVKFKVGEQLPWKGIWMQIDRVHKDRLELIPMGLTWKRNKQIKASKGE